MRRIILVMLMQTVVLASNWSVTGMTGAQSEIVVAVGRTINEGRSEIGLTGILYDEDDPDHLYDPAIGIYAATEMPIPVPVEDVKTYVGIAPMVETRDFRGILTPFVAGILYPDREVSPIITWRYNIQDGSIDNDAIPKGSVVFGGLRFLF